MEEQIIIFCQAPADLIYVIDTISRSTSRKYIIYVMNVPAIYDFIKSLNIKAEIHYIPIIELKIKSLKSILKAKRTIHKTWKSRFEKVRNSKIYFFSTSYDFYTASIIKRLSYVPSNKIFYYNHYDNLTSLQGENKFALKRYILSIIYRYVTDTRFIHKTTVNFPKFDYTKYNITKVDIDKKPKIPSRFLFKPSNNKKSILFFLSPEEFHNLSNGSKHKLFNFIKDISAENYNLILKGHPRLGKPKELMNIVNETIPDYIPSEFIDYSSIAYVVGISSAALCYPAVVENKKTISLIDILDYNDTSRVQGFKKYLNAYSNKQIIFANQEYMESNFEKTFAFKETSH